MTGERDGREDLRRRLRRSYRVAGIACWGAGLFFIAAGLGPFFCFHETFQDAVGFYALCVALPAAIAAAVAVGVIRWWIVPNLDRMSAVLASAVPQRLVVMNAGLDRRMREWVALAAPEAPSGAGPWGTVRIKTPNEGRFFPEGERGTVTVYAEEGETDGYVVIDTGRDLIWGVRVPEG